MPSSEPLHHDSRRISNKSMVAAIKRHREGGIDDDVNRFIEDACRVTETDYHRVLKKPRRKKIIDAQQKTREQEEQERREQREQERKEWNAAMVDTRRISAVFDNISAMEAKVRTELALHTSVTQRLDALLLRVEQARINIQSVKETTVARETALCQDMQGVQANECFSGADYLELMVSVAPRSHRGLLGLVCKDANLAVNEALALRYPSPAEAGKGVFVHIFSRTPPGYPYKKYDIREIRPLWPLFRESFPLDCERMAHYERRLIRHDFCVGAKMPVIRETRVRSHEHSKVAFIYKSSEVDPEGPFSSDMGPVIWRTLKASDVTPRQLYYPRKWYSDTLNWIRETIVE